MLVSPVFGILPCCNSDGFISNPVWKVNRLILRTRFFFWKTDLTFQNCNNQFFGVCIARSTAPVPVFSLGGLHSISLHFIAKRLIIFGCKGITSHQFYFLRHSIEIEKTSLKPDEVFCLCWFTYPNYGSFTISIQSDKNARFAGYMLITLVILWGEFFAISTPLQLLHN